MATSRLFVGNLPENVGENDLKSAFSSYGDITNIDIKCKPDVENDKKRFAFVTLSTSDRYIESCLKHFSSEDFHGNRLYVTKARESFLERLQREREQAQKKELPTPVQNDYSTKSDNVLPYNRKNKRKFLTDDETVNDTNVQNNKILKSDEYKKKSLKQSQNNNQANVTMKLGDKKQESDMKRLESMKRKRQEFKEKKLIIKTGLTGIDKVSNKKIIFSDNGEDNRFENTLNLDRSNAAQKKNDLFDDEGSDDGINFEIKEQFEGKKGQKVLDLQSRYKSDKRFVLDQRFAEESDEDDETSTEKKGEEVDEGVELEQADEKSKQVKILQDVLGVTIRSRPQESSSKTKAKIGMLRFDPLQPDHAKFLAPVEPKVEITKKSKKKKAKDKEELPEPQPIIEVEKVEVSKEQFYEVSDVLKEAIAQPTSFSLRSLFSKTGITEETPNDSGQSIPLVKAKDKKQKHPLDTGEKNPFVYDSSESEDEGETLKQAPVASEKIESKAVWRENLFLSLFDNRLKEGLEFFNQSWEGEIQKERRQLKSVMKKRLYNKERKNKMFQKKIGGRKKTMKKSYKNKS